MKKYQADLGVDLSAYASVEFAAESDERALEFLNRLGSGRSFEDDEGGVVSPEDIVFEDDYNTERNARALGLYEITGVDPKNGLQQLRTVAEDVPVGPQSPPEYIHPGAEYATAEHEVYTLEQWKYEVVNDATRLGYGEWVLGEIEANEGVAA